jgi:hypothetical protein
MWKEYCCSPLGWREICTNCPELRQCTNNKKEEIKDTLTNKSENPKKRNVTKSLDSF